MTPFLESVNSSPLVAEVCAVSEFALLWSSGDVCYCNET